MLLTHRPTSGIETSWSPCSHTSLLTGWNPSFRSWGGNIVHLRCCRILGKRVSKVVLSRSGFYWKMVDAFATVVLLCEISPIEAGRRPVGSRARMKKALASGADAGRSGQPMWSDVLRSTDCRLSRSRRCQRRIAVENRDWVSTVSAEDYSLDPVHLSAPNETPNWLWKIGMAELS